jgi:hypothetical protein
MIDDQTKEKVMLEFEKSGNVWASCAKLNISRSTVYRWRESDKEFRRSMDKALRIGRDNMNDFSEHSLMVNVKKGIQRAIEYHLSHRHKGYKSKNTSFVTFDYKKNLPPPKPAVTCEDLEVAARGEDIEIYSLLDNQATTDNQFNNNNSDEEDDEDND